jgi:hypothetical protein
LPFTPKQTIKERILNLAVDVPAFAQQTFLPEAKSFDCANGTSVPRIDVSFEAAQIQHIKSVGEQSSKSFIHVAVTPMPASQSITDLGPSIFEVQVEKRGRPDELIVVALSDTPLEHKPPVKEIMNFVQKAYCGLPVGERWRTPIPHDLRIRKDIEQRLEVIFRDATETESASGDCW